ncbi:hypothetical protein DSC45_28100 [Streptomyces sp. YIM 130001]|uniref:DUF6286 domain-containing protein n=1 Tax=Streptomyces sp. YIM 130001 TaxID=2259644 RepID=UPI000EEBCF36|nr:DUF6286 domain-containing protein [Streptomyces sp. YIM 130001]RII11778.1 hypothetical protein DSC45_28100 [Streptomyces sp. YIM 130001]
MTTAADRGTTVVSDRAVRRIAERAATEPAAPETGSRVRAGTAKGSASVHGRRADVAVEVALPYPTGVHEAARELQAHVTRRTRELTGLDIRRARVGVTALLPGVRSGEPAVEASRADEAAVASRTPLRWWSRRSGPMVLLTLMAAVVCGAAAYDLLRVHVGHRPPAAWRTDTLDWLAQHGPGDPVAVAGAALLVALGIAMILLAVTPGCRSLLTLGPPRDPSPSASPPSAAFRAAMDRSAVSLLVRDAVGDVSGVGPVRVRVGRRRVAVRARLDFGEPAAARQQITRAARAALDSCCLRRPPRLRVRVRAAPHPIPGPRTDSGAPDPRRDSDTPDRTPCAESAATESAAPGSEGASHP